MKLFTNRDNSDMYITDMWRAFEAATKRISEERHHSLSNLPEFGSHSWLLSDHTRKALQRSAHYQWWTKFVDEAIASTNWEEEVDMGSNAHWLFMLMLFDELNEIVESRVNSWKTFKGRPAWPVPTWAEKAMKNGLRAIVNDAIRRHCGDNAYVTTSFYTSLFHEGCVEIEVVGKMSNTVVHIPFNAHLGCNPDEKNNYWRDILWAVMAYPSPSIEVGDPGCLTTLEDFATHWAVKSRID